MRAVIRVRTEFIPPDSLFYLACSGTGRFPSREHARFISVQTADSPTHSIPAACCSLRNTS